MSEPMTGHAYRVELKEPNGGYLSDIMYAVNFAKVTDLAREWCAKERIGTRISQIVERDEYTKLIEDARRR